jgi:hypothetical protein
MSGFINHLPKWISHRKDICLQGILDDEMPKYRFAPNILPAISGGDCVLCGRPIRGQYDLLICNSCIDTLVVPGMGPNPSVLKPAVCVFCGNERDNLFTCIDCHNLFVRFLEMRNRHMQDKEYMTCARRGGIDPEARWIFLETDEWKEKRKIIFEFYGDRCLICRLGGKSEDGPLSVHHCNGYKNKGKEPLFDLIPVCRHHHEFLHGKSPTGGTHGQKESSNNCRPVFSH